MPLKYCVVTFGCRVNQADSLAFEEDFLARGGVAVAPELADVVVVNTCSVTASADQAARQTVRRIARVNPAAKIVVTGCYATRRPDDIGQLPNVIRLIPNDDKPTLVATTADRFGDGEGSCGAAIEPGVAGRTAFTLRVQTGCAEPCSYCIIPTTRGQPRSVPIDNVLAEVERVTAAGFKEITLTGVHLGSYGRDLSPRSSLLELLRRMAGFTRARAFDRLRLDPSFVEGRESTLEREVLERAVGGAPASGVKNADSRARATADTAVLFRISSLEPMDCTRGIVNLVAASDCFAPHFHLPLQHASDKVLAAMRRPYTIEQYASLVDDIRARLPHAAIGSDVIVGFPGETDEDFDELAGYLESSPLTHLHVFPYSDRPGTVASTLGGRAHGSVVRERARRVREIGLRLAEAFRLSQVGTMHRGLTLEDGSLVVTGNYLKVRIPPGRARNEWIDVRIT